MKLELKYREGDLPKKKMVEVTGLQQGEHQIWVFNKLIHVNSSGKQVLPVDSPYIWIKQPSDNVVSSISSIKRSKSNLQFLVAILV